MNFVSLVTHGLSAISVYSDVVGVRLLVMSVLLAIATLAGILHRVDRATGDELGHSGLGELYRGPVADPVRSGGHGRFRVQLRDPRFTARFNVSAASGLFFLHRHVVDGSWPGVVRNAAAGPGADERGHPAGEVESCHTFTSARSSTCSPRP